MPLNKGSCKGWLQAWEEVDRPDPVHLALTKEKERNRQLQEQVAKLKASRKQALAEKDRCIEKLKAKLERLHSRAGDPQDTSAEHYCLQSALLQLRVTELERELQATNAKLEKMKDQVRGCNKSLENSRGIKRELQELREHLGDVQAKHSDQVQSLVSEMLDVRAQLSQVRLTDPSETLRGLHQQGYVTGAALDTHAKHQVALRFLREHLKLSDQYFSHDKNCYYLTNHCGVDQRGAHRFIRPSQCSKFVLRAGLHLFSTTEHLCTYHGTDPSNIQSILDYGLQPPGTVVGAGKVVQSCHGRAMGHGVYTTMVPLYAQVYAPAVRFGDHWVQVLLMLRQHPDSVKVAGDEGKSTAALLGRYDLHKLYGGQVMEKEVQYVTRDATGLVPHALLIKVHDQPPKDQGGEYNDVSSILNVLSQ